MEKIKLIIEINAPKEFVWRALSEPKWITTWNFASKDWICPKARIDLQVGKGFNYRMEASDGSVGFNFEGNFTSVTDTEAYTYVMADGREVSVSLQQQGLKTLMTEIFDPESEHPIELQRAGWLAILENLKQVVETQVYQKTVKG